MEEETEVNVAEVQTLSWYELLTYIVLITVIIYLLKKIFTPAPPPPRYIPPVPKKIVMRDYTPEELQQYDGRTAETPIYMAVKGRIFDVSHRRMFYGPDAAYGIFAGKDASRGLALGSLDDADVNGDLEGLEPMELDALDDWTSNFMSKYDHIGYLVEDHKTKIVINGERDKEHQQSEEEEDKVASKDTITPLKSGDKDM